MLDLTDWFGGLVRRATEDCQDSQATRESMVNQECKVTRECQDCKVHLAKPPRYFIFNIPLAQFFYICLFSG
jgi:hypothetical protein